MQPSWRLGTFFAQLGCEEGPVVYRRRIENTTQELQTGGVRTQIGVGIACPGTVAMDTGAAVQSLLLQDLAKTGDFGQPTADGRHFHITASAVYGENEILLCQKLQCLPNSGPADTEFPAHRTFGGKFVPGLIFPPGNRL